MAFPHRLQPPDISSDDFILECLRKYDLTVFSEIPSSDAILR